MEEDLRFDTVPILTTNMGLIVLIPAALFFGGFVEKAVALSVAVVIAVVLMIVDLAISGFYLRLGDTLLSYPFFLAAGMIFSLLIGVMAWRLDMLSLIIP